MQQFTILIKQNLFVFVLGKINFIKLKLVI
jgi:hypothetical protein